MASRVATSMLFLLLLAACDRATAGPATIATAPEWRLADSPRVSIGVLEGDEHYMFRAISGTFVRRDGQIVVADREPALTLFDPTGVFVKRIGARGTGPGEFQFLMMPPFAYRGDSMALWDHALRRLSIFDAGGIFGRSANVVVPLRFWSAGTIPSQSCCRVTGAFSDGSFVLEYPSLIPNQPGPTRHATLMLARVSTDGSRSDTIGVFHDSRYRYDATAPNKIRSIRLSMRFMYTLIGDTIVGGNGEGPWILRLAPGAAPDTIRLSEAPIPVTDSVKAAYADAWRAEQKRRPEIFEGPVESLFDGEYAGFLPAYNRVAADPAGNMWLGQWGVPFSSSPWRFHVYSSRGDPVARIDLPARSWIGHIGADYVALIETDSLGVESVRVYDIIRPAAH